MTDNPETTEPKKKKHRLRKLVLLASAVAAVAGYRQRKLAANDYPPPR